MPARDIALVLVICMAWAANFLASAYALREIPPFLFSGLRLALVALVLAPWIKAPPRAMRMTLLGIAVCTGVLHFGLNFWALKLAGDLGSVAILMQSYVPMSALLARVLRGESLSLRTLGGIAFSFSGVLVLGLDPHVLAHPSS